MSDIAIRVEGLGKQYQIGAMGPRYKTLRESLTGMMASPFRQFLRGEGRVTPQHTVAKAIEEGVRA